MHLETNGPPVLFDVWNSTFCVDKVKLVSDTRPSALALIRCSSFVISHSEIVSCSEISPFMVGYSGLGSSTSISIISCHHTSSSGLSSLLPLVTGPTRSFSSKRENRNEEAREDTFGAGCVSISGNSLSIVSTHFVVGTGPLFDFGRLAEASVDLGVKYVVSLSSSQMVNTTSTRSSSIFVGRRMSLTQRLVGSLVTHSTNHFSGTSGIDLSWEADTLVSNCSFSHIVTNTAPAPVTEPPTPSDATGLHYHEYDNRHVSHTGQIFTHKPVWVISCIFNGLSSTAHGGGVQVQNNKGSVVVKHSTFTNCRTTQNGGALSVMFNIESSDAGKHDLTIFGCQFSKNTAGGLGGHILAQCYKSTTIARCTFSDSRSTTSTPLTQNTAMNILFQGPSRIDNCTVSNNEGRASGGMSVWMIVADGNVDLTDVLFMNNICTYATESARITDFSIWDDTGTFTAYDCFSTSTLPRSGVLKTEPIPHTVTSVLPDLVGPTISKLVVEKQVSSAGTGFVVAVTMEGMFTGTTRKYDVTVKSSTGTTIVAKGVSFGRTSGTMTIPMSTSSATSLVPSTSYTITEVKTSSSESTSNTFEVGEETEPDWTWWHHTSSSRAGNLIGMPFETPSGPVLTSVSAKLNPSNLNEVILTLTAARVATGPLTLIVCDASDPTETPITVGTVSFATTPLSEVETTVIVSVHPSGLLAYGTTYNVKSIQSPVQVLTFGSVSFTMSAAPARLTGATASLDGLNKTFVTVSMEGEQLPAGKEFSIVVKEMEGDGVKADTTPITLSGTIGGSNGLVTSCSVSVEIYKNTGTVEYGKDYQIVSLTADGKAGVADPTAHFSVPDSPCRIEGTGTPTLNGAQTEVSVVVTGVSFSSSITAATVQRGSAEISSISLTVDSDTQMTVVFNAGLSETVSVLEYEGEYEIWAITSTSESFINVGVKFTVPMPPIITSASTELDTSRNTHFRVLVAGKDLISGSAWKMKLTGRNEEIPVTMTGTDKGESEWVKAGGPNEIEFDKAYTIASLTKSSNASEHIVCNDMLFTTPAGPTLTNIAAELNPSNLNSAILTITAERIAEGDLTLTVFDAADSTQTSIALGAVSFATSTTPISSTISVVIRPSGKLAYGKTYKVKTLSSPSLIVSHASPSVQIPSLIKTVSCSLDLSDTNRINLFISAIGLPPSSSLTLTVVEVDGDNSPQGTPFTIDGVTSLEEGEVTHNLALAASPSTLQQGKRYEVTQSEIPNHKSALDGNLVFTVPNIPVLTAVPFSFASSANNSFFLVLEGTDLPVGETFLVTLNSFPNPIEVTFETTTTGSSVKLPIGESHDLQYSTTYTLVSVIHKGLPLASIPCTGLSFTTGPRPSFMFLFVSSSGSDENEGTENAPLRTLHKALVRTETESIENDEMIAVSDSCSIGELTEFGLLKEGTTVAVEGGEGRRIICSISEMEKRDGKRMGQQKAMISLKRNTLSFSELTFEVRNADSWIGSVFLVGEDGVLSLESSEVRSSVPIAHTFVWVKKTGLFEGKELAITSISFGGKGSVMAVNEEGRLRLADCSFEGLSFVSGGVVVGKTEADIRIEESVFSKCSGREFGSVIRLSTGGDLSMLSSRFLNCSTEVRFSEKSSGVMGGGSVVIEIDTNKNSRSQSSSQIDLSDCVFSGCRLRSTEGSGWSVGGVDSRLWEEVEHASFSDECSCATARVLDCRRWSDSAGEFVFGRRDRCLWTAEDLSCLAVRSDPSNSLLTSSRPPSPLCDTICPLARTMTTNPLVLITPNTLFSCESVDPPTHPVGGMIVRIFCSLLSKRTHETFFITICSLRVSIFDESHT
ncbi:hypothetical protein BLNAU_12304 [Blattamonas nauphoetae]|uniref:Uncharacterized protein n=1 Tax=Blattamonas nauphoetae TaxID=2049346 RepID=A0ABQ9XME0_9EUKA|nr:hypothetical protein BLNAU_12304 [Blattamonas nauphoetae]